MIDVRALNRAEPFAVIYDDGLYEILAPSQKTKDSPSWPSIEWRLSVMNRLSLLTLFTSIEYPTLKSRATFLLTKYL